jgi:hypothetical protein
VVRDGSKQQKKKGRTKAKGINKFLLPALALFSFLANNKKKKESFFRFFFLLY